MKKQNSMCLIFVFIMAILGAILGAGFASGKEIQTFFTNYGVIAYALVVIALGMFAWTFYLFARIGKIVKPHSIADITKATLGKISFAVDIVLVLSMFVTLSAMLSATDGLAQTLFSEYSFPWASIIMALLVVLILSGGKKSMFDTNNIVMPMVAIILLVVLICFFAFAPKENVMIEWVQSGARQCKGLLFAFLYVGLNTISESFIVARASEKMDKNQAFKASVCCSCLIAVLIVLISTALLKSGDYIYESSLPLLKLAFMSSNGLGNAYSFVLLLAIFTTTVSTTYTMTSWLKQYVKNKFASTIIIVVVGFILSRFGFANIVETFYPLKGVLGVVLIVAFSMFYFKQTTSKQLDYQYSSKIYY